MAAALMTTAAVALAQLVALGVRQTSNSRVALEALTSAQGKLEELRALTWSHRVPASDLALSPAGSLTNDTPGYVDGGTPFVRRWAITRRDAADAELIVIDVCVFRDNRTRAEACVSSMRTRRP